MPDKDIDKIPITVEVPKADVWVRNDYRDIVRRLGEVHMIRACEHQHDDDFVPLYDLQTVRELRQQLLADIRAAIPANMTSDKPYRPVNLGWSQCATVMRDYIDAKMQEVL